MSVPKALLTPYWQTTDGNTVRLYLGDVLGVLQWLPSGSVHCVITSPPYWGLRDYNTGTWEGGNDADCDHKHPGRDRGATNWGEGDKWVTRGNRHVCPKGCGAIRSGDRQLGSEDTPAEYIAAMVGICREIRRVLRDDGTFWLNMGDCYREGGNLVGMPWRLALALQEDGWILRQDIVWHKPDPMPESVMNRCTKAHEYVFLLTKKGSGYYYDAEAIKEKANRAGVVIKYDSTQKSCNVGDGINDRCTVPRYTREVAETRNKRDVWTIRHQSYHGAHFAIFPEALVEPCILAGTSEFGCCAKCSAPWQRLVSRIPQPPEDWNFKPGNDPKMRTRTCGNSGRTQSEWKSLHPDRTIGWYPTCKCYGLPELPTQPPGKFQDRYSVWLTRAEELCGMATKYGPRAIPCTVMDPFIGSGTTAVVALSHGKRAVGIDLSEEYLRIHAVGRIEGVLLSRPTTVALVGRERKGMGWVADITESKGS